MEIDPFGPEPPPIIFPTRTETRDVVSRSSPIGLILSTSIALGIALISLTFLSPWHIDSTIWMEPAIGYMFGTTFGVALVAAFWCTLGPGPFAYRMPISLLWIGGIFLSWLGNHLMHEYALPLEAILVITISSGAMWLVPQLPLWCFRLLTRVSVALPQTEAAPNANQFGIRQLIIFTTIIAVLLSAARVAIAAFGNELPRTGEPVIAFAFLVSAGILLSAPLIFAMLLPRYCVVAVVLVLGLSAIACFLEAPLIQMLTKSRGGGPSHWLFLWLNAFAAVWIMALTGIAKIYGYRLVRSK